MTALRRRCDGQAHVFGVDWALDWPRPLDGDRLW
jgi:hypothetical protein